MPIIKSLTQRNLQFSAFRHESMHGRKSLFFFSVLLLFVSGLMTPVQAEHTWDHRYTIYGKVTDLSGGAARFVTATVDCSEGATDASLCEHNIGRSSSTGLYGSFELELHVDPGTEVVRVVLIIDGQKFNHTIDIAGPDGEPTPEERKVSVTFELDHEKSNVVLYAIIIGVIITVVAIVRFIVVRGRNITLNTSSVSYTSISSAGKTSTTELVGCPRCDARLKRSNLQKHLMKKHYLKSEEASALIGGDDGE